MQEVSRASKRDKHVPSTSKHYHCTTTTVTVITPADVDYANHVNRLPPPRHAQPRHPAPARIEALPYNHLRGLRSRESFLNYY